MTQTHMLFLIPVPGSLVAHHVAVPEAHAAALSATLGACRGLIPGEVAQRLSAAFAALDITVLQSEFRPIPAPSPAIDPDNIPASPPGEPLDPPAPGVDPSASDTPTV
jgi:hypothetical protein